MEVSVKYNNTTKAIFINRPNRFIANVLIDGKIETVHVKNTGRCKELLYENVTVILEKSDNPSRKTKYDLIMVYKDKIGWVNIDSQVPNKVVYEWLIKQDYDFIKPEYKYGNSRIDFYMEKGEDKFLMEVKGCTLEVDGIGYFPDAPTERGVKHLKELAKAAKANIKCFVAFVIQMNGIDIVKPNVLMHEEFALAWDEAVNAGVKILFLKCFVDEYGITIQ